ncbi:MAG: DUF1501 domain-containing protein [Planctomycetia bacterium]|nr:DUF1501 domain-containing protein [Planctomycetia bacterium]
MLRILGSPKRLCDGLSRRDLLKVGTLGALSAGFDCLLPRQAAAAPVAGAPGGFGRAKSCILLYLYGAASQIETFDPKPQAPVEIRGELGAIPTIVPGVQIGELLPHTAQIVDRTAIVRSMTHPYPLHASAYTMTSNPTIDVPLQMSPRDPRHWPFIGSVIEYLDSRAAGGRARSGIARNVGLPWRLSSRRQYAAGDNAGPYAAFLGSAWDPVWTDFEGEGTRESTYTFDNKTITCRDPYGPLKPGARFGLAKEAELPVDVTLDRLNHRRSLLSQFNDARRVLDRRGREQGFDRFQEMAFSYLTTDAMRDALDVDREPAAIREQYGMTLFGQSTLVARRLVEAGARFVTVLWDEYEMVNSAWDTHFYHYSLMRGQLCPGFDRAFSALILDLEARGLLDETLIICTTEHGRTPKIVSAQGGGRDHWSRAYSSVLAGGGAARGKVVGRTNAIAGEVTDTPISPKDILATAYHLLGVDPHTLITDRLGRPLPIGGEGRVVAELVG